MLLFEFNGSRDFNVIVIGNDLRKIEYRNIVHFGQKKRPRVSMNLFWPSKRARVFFLFLLPLKIL